MLISLHSFEQQIDETILKRGLQYFKKGLVNEPEETGLGEFEAIVEGTEPYIVRISIHNDVITEHLCSCPYDMGPVCKHVVALIFHLQQNESGIKVKAKKNSAESKKTTKKKTIAEEVDEILGKISPESLNEYIRELCSSDRSFRQLFLGRFAHLIMPETKALYARQIKSILRSVTHQGYIEYQSMGFVGQAVFSMLENARTQAGLSNFRTAMNIACAVLEEMVKALQFADDSNGDIGGTIEIALEILNTLAESPIPDELRRELLEFCLTNYNSGIFKGWDWHFDMLFLAVELVESQQESGRITALLDQVQPGGSGSEWRFETAQRIRLKLIDKIDGPAKGQLFMEQNSSISGFRKMLIEKAINEKEYSRGLALADEGIEKDRKEFPGRAGEWREYMLKIYVLQKDTGKILNYARQLFISSNQFQKPFYELLKQHVAPAEWEQYVDSLVKELSVQYKFSLPPLLADLYIWEERWQD